MEPEVEDVTDTYKPLHKMPYGTYPDPTPAAACKRSSSRVDDLRRRFLDAGSSRAFASSKKELSVRDAAQTEAFKFSFGSSHRPVEDEPLDGEGFRKLMPGVKYKELRAGTGPQAEYKQAVICTWTASLTETGEVFEVGRRKMLRVGDGDVPPGLELCLRQQRDGTKCICRAEWRFAYGEGRPASAEQGTMAVPPRAAVTWELETHRLWYKECDEAMTPAEQLVEARNKKELGNEHFHHGDWRKAGANYQEVLKGLNVWNHDEGSADRREAEDTYVHCANNLVFALMKMDEWLKAERAACDALCVAPADKKALYRATQVALHLSKWAEADAALKLALDQWPNHRQFRVLYETLREHRRKYRARKAAMSRRMADGLAKHRAAEPEPEPESEPESGSDLDDDAWRGVPAPVGGAQKPPLAKRLLASNLFQLVALAAIVAAVALALGHAEE